MALNLRDYLPHQLKIWQKLALVCLVFVFPVAVLAYFMLSAQQAPISFAQKELIGDVYLRPTRTLMEGLLEHRAAMHQQLLDKQAPGRESTDSAVKVETALKALDDVDAKYGVMLSQKDRTTVQYLAAIKKKWQEIQTQKDRLTPAASDALHLDAARENRTLIALVGDTSNLILDPDLDSYYCMDSSLIKLPELMSLLSDLQNYAEEVVGKKALTAEERTQLVVKTGLVVSLLDALTGQYTGLPAAYRRENDSTPDKSLEAKLAPALQRAVAAARAYVDLVQKKLIEPAAPEGGAAEFAQSSNLALLNTFALWDEVIKTLDQLLDKRIAAFRADQRLTLAFSIAALVVALLLVYTIVRGITKQLTAMNDLFFQLGIGNFQARARVVSTDELGRMAEVINENILPLVQSREERDQIQQSISKLLVEVGGVADGDLTKEAEVSTDVTGAIADSFNYMIEQLRKVISNVQDSTVQVSSSANEIHATAEHLASGTESQAEQIVNTSAAIDEMAVSIQQVSENAALSTSVAQQALQNAKQGAEAVYNTIDGMNRIRDQVQETAKRIKRLGESSQEIGQIIQLIDDIADRTSILALNASIQAAMAGDAGRGFAVVAEEVERLAVRSTDATKKIATLVKTIQSETGEAVNAMEKGIKEVVDGSRLANQAGKSLTEIEGVSKQLADLIQSISLASKQQARGSEALAKSMGEISQITQQTAAGTKQAAVSVNGLASLADELRSSVSTFRLPGRSAHANGGPAPGGKANGHANGKDGKDGKRMLAPLPAGKLART